MPKQFWMHSQKTENIGFLFSTPFSLENNSLYADFLYFPGPPLRNIEYNEIPKIAGYCLDEVNLGNSKIVLFDYSYLKYERCT